MKKIFAVLALAAVLMSSAIFPSFAAESLKDGVYQVPIQLRHAEKDAVSMGDSYILHTALLEVKNKDKYITIVSDSSVMNLEFSYYTDGSVSGNTTQAQKVKNVEIGGKTYSVGYRFPVLGDWQLLGVKFKASIMPVSPSARVYIDYSKAVMISSDETATVPSTTAPATTAPSKADETSATVQSSQTASGIKEPSAAKEEVSSNENISPSEDAQVSETQGQLDRSPSESAETTSPHVGQKESGGKSLIAGIAAAVVVIAIAAGGIMIKSKIGKSKLS